MTAVNTFGANGLLARHTAAGSVFYAFDQQGSTAQRLDGAGNVLSAHGFDAFGASLTANAAPADPYAGFGAQWGYRADAETGLLLLGERYYDPASGRFLNRDPAGYEGGINLYAYCSGEPIAFTDPTGRQQDTGFGGPEDTQVAIQTLCGGLGGYAGSRAGGTAGMIIGVAVGTVAGNRLYHNGGDYVRRQREYLARPGAGYADAIPYHEHCLDPILKAVQDTYNDTYDGFRRAVHRFW